MVLNNLSLYGSNRTGVDTTVAPLSNVNATKPGATGTHTSYETDANGNRVEVTYDSTGRITGSRKVGTTVGSEFNAVRGGSQMNQSNWQRLLSILREKLGINL